MSFLDQVLKKINTLEDSIEEVRRAVEKEYWEEAEERGLVVTEDAGELLTLLEGPKP